MSTTKPTLYKFGVRRKRIGFGLNKLHSFWNNFQRVWVKLELVLQSFFARILGHFDISSYALFCSEEGFEGADELFRHVKEIFKEAKEIRMAVGEMGYRLLERSPLVDSLQHAYEKNQATIEIVHGPRVDLKTRRVFELEKCGVVSLFRMPEYKRHHFILVTSVTDQVSVIDEGTHNEIVWMEDELGNPIPILTGQVRFYYIKENSKRRVPYLEEEYESRKRNAVPISEHPGLSPPQDHSAPRILADILLNIPVKHVFQPLAILFDLPLDLRLERVYKIISSKVSRLEKHPQPYESQVSVVTSPEDVISLAEQIASKVKPNPLSQATLTEALQGFLQAIYDSSGPAAIAAVDRRERYVRPILDIYVLWSSPIQLSSDAQMREMDEVEDKHTQFLGQIEPHRDSFISIVDLRRYPSPEDLQAELSSQFDSANVLACARLQR